MKVFFYASEATPSTQRLEGLIQELAGAEEMEVFRNIGAFAAGIRRPKLSGLVAVVAAATKAELRDLQSLDYLLEGVKIVLVLPENNDEMVSLGHNFRPRYMGFFDNGHENVVAVLKKMLKYQVTKDE